MTQAAARDPSARSAPAKPLPGRERVKPALHRPELRVHQDVVLNSAMLVEPSDTVLLLPATTRYEIPGGVAETTTERRIVFARGRTEMY